MDLCFEVESNNPLSQFRLQEYIMGMDKFQSYKCFTLFLIFQVPFWKFQNFLNILSLFVRHFLVCY